MNHKKIGALILASNIGMQILNQSQIVNALENIQVNSSVHNEVKEDIKNTEDSNNDNNENTEDKKKVENNKELNYEVKENKNDKKINEDVKEEKISSNDIKTTENKDVSNSIENLETQESAFTFNEKTGTITAYDVSKGGTDVVIPETINGVKVKTIGDGAFQSKNLTSVVFPEGLETIGKYSFRNNSISNLTLPNSIKNIGWEGFVNAGIQNLSLPNTMTTIPYTSFMSNPITSLTIPDSVEIIEDNAFQGCNIETINWGSGIKEVGVNAFYENQIKNLTVPVEMIGSGAFSGNPLESVTLLDSVKSVGANAFYGSSNKPTLKKIDLGNGVENIGNYAFNYGLVENIKIPASLKTIGTNVFGYQKLPYIETNENNPKTSYGNQRLDSKDIYIEDGKYIATTNFKELYPGIDPSKVEIKKITSGVTSRELPFEYDKSTGEITIKDVNVGYITIYYSYINDGNVVLTVEQRLNVRVYVTVEWKDFDGSIIRIDKEEKKYGDSLTVTPPANPIREGYTFSGWIKNPPTGSGGQFVIYRDTVFTANYTENYYNIKYDLNYEGAKNPSPKRVTWEQEGISKYIPTRKGYKFTGWYYNGKKVNDTDSVSSIVEQDPGNEADIVLKAKWTLNANEINYVPIINATDKVLTVGDTFNPLDGVSAFDNEDGAIELTEKNIIKNDVDMDNPGTYSITYKVTDSQGASAIKTITVVVNPKMEEINHIPTINATDKVLTVGDKFNPLEGVTATDDEDGEIKLTEANIIKNDVNMDKAGTYSITYKVTDSQGAFAIKTITVVINPKLEAINHIPTINATDKVLTVGDKFNPLDGVTATDNEDGAIELTEANIIKNDVDMDKVGTYSITYKVTDSQGASAIKIITVVINPKLEAINHIPTINATDKVLTVGDTFNPLDGVSAFDNEDGAIELTEKNIIKNDVDMDNPGTYSITYKVTDSQGASAIKTITVVVNPKMEEINHIPTINATDKVLTVGDKFNPLDGVTATDNEDGAIELTEANIIASDVDMDKAGVYSITYKVTDSQGASTIKTIKVVVNNMIVTINAVPIINATDKVLTVGDKFNPLEGVSAFDTEDGNITLTIENLIKNTVNMSQAGTYEVIYEVVDKQGAKATKKIIVTVKNKDIVENKPDEDIEEIKPDLETDSNNKNNIIKPSSKPSLPNTGSESSLPLMGVLSTLLGMILFKKDKKK